MAKGTGPQSHPEKPAGSVEVGAIDLIARCCGVTKASSGRFGEPPLPNAPKNYAGIDAAESEGIAQNVIEFAVEAVIRDNVKIARRIGMVPV